MENNNNINYDDLIKSINDSIVQNKLLQKAIKKIEDLGFKIVIGSEIEFYLFDFDYKDLQDFTRIEIRKEKANLQYEVDFGPYDDTYTLIGKMNNFIQESKNYAKNKIDFSPKPIENDYGNGMHFHINLIDKNRQNYFNDSQKIDISCFYLCETMLETLLVFCHNEEKISRFNHKFMAPVNVSFSLNNRTVPIRIPGTYPKRIEHRISTPTDNIESVLFIIIKSIWLSLKNGDVYDKKQIDKYKVFGNAFDEQYNHLINFPKDINEIKRLFNPSFFDDFD
jgi:glutamine synthetase